MMRGDGGVDIYDAAAPLVFLLGKFATESLDSLARRALTYIDCAHPHVERSSKCRLASS